MHLTRFSDLGLRFVMALGAGGHCEWNPEATRATVRGIAQQINASEAHAAKVVAKLAELGTVTSTRGRGGGLILSAVAQDEPVGQLLRKLEGPAEVVNCEEPECPFESLDCVLRVRLRRAQEAFFASMDDFTVGQLVERTRERIGAAPGVTALGMPAVARATA